MRDPASGWRRRPLVSQLADVGAGLGLVVAGAAVLSILGIALALLATVLPTAAP